MVRLCSSILYTVEVYDSVIRPLNHPIQLYEPRLFAREFSRPPTPSSAPDCKQKKLIILSPSRGHQFRPVPWQTIASDNGRNPTIPRHDHASAPCKRERKLPRKIADDGGEPCFRRLSEPGWTSHRMCGSTSSLCVLQPTDIIVCICIQNCT